ncbi:MAG: PEGA domain-containing protein [Gammaproteobacteria bacterium]|nr:PEGA domain-containing protein [Gammaproteobacteria bacterium]
MISNLQKAVGLVLVSAVAGCATLASGTTQNVVFNSTPTGASVLVDGVELGKTPLTIELKKKDGQHLEIRKEGFKSYSTLMLTQTDPMFWGNILIGGLPGSTTDAASGAAYQYAPESYVITLESNSASLDGFDQNYSDADRIRAYLFQNYQSLKVELSRDSGDHLEALLSMIELEGEAKELGAETLKEIMFSSENPDKFVIRVLEVFTVS